MSRRKQLLLGSLLGGAIALLSPSFARAKTRYPGYIQDYFCGGNSGGPGGGSGCSGGGTATGSPICQNKSQTEPPCRLCHIQGTTGSGTIQTPFGVSMLARGLSGSNGSVCSALAALAADDVDSDGDGTTDVVELENLTDPNTAANVSWAEEPTPTYGCGVAPGPRGGWLAAAVSMLAALLLRRSRRRG
jgi:hypothetical protein